MTRVKPSTSLPLVIAQLGTAANLIILSAVLHNNRNTKEGDREAVVKAALLTWRLTEANTYIT